MPQRVSSPATGVAISSRPTSSHGAVSNSSEGKSDTHRQGPPGSLGPLPAPMFANVKAVVSPAESGAASDTTPTHSHSMGPTPPAQPKVLPGGAPVGIAMEGLSHQGAHMGPPSTLHDRVVFVSNVSLRSIGEVSR